MRKGVEQNPAVSRLLVITDSDTTETEPMLSKINHFTKARSEKME